ncbi:hypothetical protein BaRGS_00037190, partial [Batillaria attramentaria]
ECQSREILVRFACRSCGTHSAIWWRAGDRNARGSSHRLFESQSFSPPRYQPLERMHLHADEKEMRHSAFNKTASKVHGSEIDYLQRHVFFMLCVTNRLRNEPNATSIQPNEKVLNSFAGSHRCGNTAGHA